MSSTHPHLTPFNTDSYTVNTRDKLSPVSNCGFSSVSLSGFWVAAYGEWMRAHGHDGLVLNRAHGWLDQDLEFLSQLPWLKSLSILAEPELQVDPINSLELLAELSFAYKHRGVLQLDSMPCLEKLSVTWWPGMSSLVGATQLRSLTGTGLPERCLMELSSRSRLEQLHLYRSSFTCPHWLTEYEALAELELTDCRKLASFPDLSHLKQLQWIAVRGRSRIDGIDFVASMQGLRYLCVDGLGEISSLEPLRALQDLRVLALGGRKFRVLDCDLSPVADLKQLSLLGMPIRRQYSHV